MPILTPAEITRMIAKAQEWSNDNPFKYILLDRLGILDHHGGQYRAPTTANCSKCRREQVGVDLQREAVELRGVDCSPF